MTFPSEPRRWWRYVRGLALPVLLWGAFVGGLIVYVQWSRMGDEQYDEAALEEWIDESRVFRQTLPQLVREYRQDPSQENASKVQTHLATLGDVTKMYNGELPLFPTIYRLELTFTEGPGPAPQ